MKNEIKWVAFAILLGISINLFVSGKAIEQEATEQNKYFEGISETEFKVNISDPILYKEMWKEILGQFNNDYLKGLKSITASYNEKYEDGMYYYETEEITILCAKKDICEAIFYHEVGHHIMIYLLNNEIRSEICILDKETQTLTNRANDDWEEYFAELFRIYHNRLLPKLRLFDEDYFKKQREVTNKETEFMEYIKENIVSINSTKIIEEDNRLGCLSED